MIVLLASEDDWLTLTIDGVLHRVKDASMHRYDRLTNTWVKLGSDAPAAHKFAAWFRKHREYIE